ncbi:S-methyl-5-thioribose-1-phosphate isomerase [Thalassobaculum sp. OXR-137]|uniref:S-methyl-5-thioribose-1-phosphate isomerase n=1 Tax=Thalassobaculum sp. OXR-137 TaxID=3100173 RepID=UPI002AC90523|nr:S-methyl-5-thioribose-1-phosphate isomerase [Thalassobaculum sp. OXR-137]WPZ32418.1 S-methyl-5-thioribose-1-phosphate isomerase [Thalassobaculum sp. OXR-137]
MKVNGIHYRPIWQAKDGTAVEIIDQTKLPHAFETLRLSSMADAAHAIKAMLVRGAPLIGATAAWGLWLAMREDASDGNLEKAYTTLMATRPTAVNLRWALDAGRAKLAPLAPDARVAAAKAFAEQVCDEDAELNHEIGRHGLEIIRAIAAKKPDKTVNILTHCNAGWLATVDWGTATSPIYQAHDEGIPVHVWVDETRPRNQGAFLTAWELNNHGVPHTVIVDNAGGHLMQHGQVDMVITGTDRVTANGDVANKIGTYLKALAAYDNGVPFYVALPSPTIDWTLDDGMKIEIEERSGEEVTKIPGRLDDGTLASVTITPKGSPAGNPAFDVTPARLVTGLITERGVCEATPTGLLSLFPEHRAAGE